VRDGSQAPCDLQFSGWVERPEERLVGLASSASKGTPGLLRGEVINIGVSVVVAVLGLAILIALVGR
jgi:hypothetical protein